MVISVNFFGKNDSTTLKNVKSNLFIHNKVLESELIKLFDLMFFDNF